MEYLKRIIPGLLILVLSSSALFAQDISSVIKEAPNQEAFWSVTVRDSDGKILESFNTDKVIIPASNQKLQTTAAVLDRLGSDFQYETRIYGAGEQEDNIWKGDLIVKGSGDPSISGDLYEDDRYFVFRHFLEQLKIKGIDKIEGDLVADVSIFDDQWYPKGWDWYDMSFYYGVQISPLSFNNNAVDLEVYAEGEPGEVPRITWFPDNTDYVNFINEQLITEAGTEYDEYYQRELGDNMIVLKSTMPVDYIEEESLSIHDPALFFLDSFRDFLKQNGLEVSGRVYVADRGLEASGMQELAVHRSKPLSVLVDWANKESDNFYTEMLLKTLDNYGDNEPGTFEGGIEEVRKFLGSIGLDTTKVVMNDGSGMAAGNFNTTSNISLLLVKMREHSCYDSFLNSLAIAGIDGSLAYRMKETPLYNNFRGKTGFLTGVRTLAGVFESKSGREITVSIATNNFISEKVSPVDRAHEQILMYLYEKY